MKLGIQNYAVIEQIKKSYIKFNNKINSLQIYDTAQNYRILQKVDQRLSEHNLKISKYRHIQMLGQRKS
jgi:hypothetical protein